MQPPTARANHTVTLRYCCLDRDFNDVCRDRVRLPTSRARERDSHMLQQIDGYTYVERIYIVLIKAILSEQEYGERACLVFEETPIECESNVTKRRF